MNEPWITSLEKEYVMQAMDPKYWTGDTKESWYWNEQFQIEFARYIGREYCITTPSCTTAIDLLLHGLDIKRGDEIIVPNLTWIASVSSAYHMGAKLVFCDIEKENWCIDPEKVEELITPKTKAVIAVDLYGNMPNYSRLSTICWKHSIHLIEDSAEAIGSSDIAIKAGRFGIGSVFSFHRTKSLTTGEGGALLLDDKNLYNKCIQLRDHGKHPTAMYWNEIVGFKYMTANVLSAIGLAQLHRINEILDKKRKQFLLYKKYLDIPNIQWCSPSKGGSHGYWIPSFVYKQKIHKQSVITQLRHRQIPSRPFFYPLNELPPFDIQPDLLTIEDLLKPNKPNTCPISFTISNHGISLPSSPYLTEEEIKYICDSIKEILQT